MKRTKHKDRQQRGKRSLRRRAHRPMFCLYGNNLPIAGLPEPRPCPFCSSTDIRIELTQDKGPDLSPHWRAAAWCEGCGSQGAPATHNDESLVQSHDAPAVGIQYRIVATAAYRWNRRNGRGAS